VQERRGCSSKGMHSGPAPALLRPKGEQSAESDAKDTCLVFPEETGSDGLRI
jgi:hypothetical protein